ncbi:hypothetical protein QFE97_08090 [Bacillus subtilis]|nr:hypothetical protein QFE97_08090 [Bacillus subtilis]
MTISWSWNISLEIERTSLETQATDFAQRLTKTVRAVAPQCDPFKALNIEGTPRVSVRQNPSVGIPLAVGGQPFLNLKVDYRCCLDRDGDFLAVEKSKIEVVPMAGTGPIFRYEYDRNSGKVPSAHMHVHAHRDAFTFLMAKAGQSTRRARLRADANAVPSLQSIHFPLGGHRFRPCLEDVLETLIEEFGVDKQEGTMAALKDGRAEWRRTQTRAVVRDDPASAIDVLRNLGYDVEWASEGDPPSVRWDRLQQH